MWKEERGREATYRALISAAEEARDQQLADNIRDMGESLNLYLHSLNRYTRAKSFDVAECAVPVISGSGGGTASSERANLV